MTARNFALLAAAIFAVMAIVQFMRAVSGWQITAGEAAIPIWLSWIAAIVLAVLA